MRHSCQCSQWYKGKWVARALASVGLTVGLASAPGVTAIANAVPADSAAHGLDQFAWHKRVLLVFAPGPQTALLDAQRTIIAEHHGTFADRDIVTIEVVGDRVRGAGVRDSSVSAERLRRHYEVADNAFQVLLVGKDTGVKVRSNRPLAASQLSQTIDAMPMRQQEMRSPGP